MKEITLKELLKLDSSAILNYILEEMNDFYYSIKKDNLTEQEFYEIILEIIKESKEKYKKEMPYIDYVKKHRINPTEEEKEITILMDEPDRNLSLDNIKHIKAILSFHKPQTQLIAVIHNPLLIYNLSKVEGINFIEMTEGYIDKVKNMVDELVK